VEAQIKSESLQPFADQAAVLFRGDETEGLEIPYVAFVAATQFAALSILNKLTSGDKVIVGLLEEVLNRLPRSTLTPSSSALQQRLVDRLVVSETERLRKVRFIEPATFSKEVELFARRLGEEGDLAAASRSVSSVALFWCARWLARTSPDRARDLLHDADAVGLIELAQIARAFVEGGTSWAKALELLKPVEGAAKLSAGLFIKHQSSSPAEALQWLDDIGSSLDDLDPEGKFLALTLLLDERRWEEALHLVNTLVEQDWLSCPALMHSAALTHLVQAVPLDLRELLLGQLVPFAAADFPLSDDPGALARRRTSVALMTRFSHAASELGAGEAAQAAQHVVLWLRLRDPEAKTSALTDLRARLETPETAVAVIPLALQFGIPLDETRVESALRREAALNPGGSPDAGVARFAITVQKLGHARAAEALDYFERHRDEIQSSVVPEAAIELEVNLLAASGSPTRAEDLVRERAQVLGASRVDRLLAMLSGEGEQVRALEVEYARQPSLQALKALIIALRPQGFSTRLYELWRELLRQTNALNDAEELMRFLQAHGRFREVDEVLTDIVALIRSSLELQAAAAWMHYRAGNFSECQRLLSALLRERDDPNDRALHVNLLVSAGRWPELHGFVEAEWPERNARSAPEVLSLAQLAGQIGSPRLKHLLELAAEKAAGDAGVLVGCYTTASQYGLEATPEAHSWFAQAAASSSEDGPIKTASLEELVAGAPEWNARSKDVRTKWRLGELPIWLAAKGLRRSALDLQLSAMLHNRAEADVRRRTAIPCFSGVRSPSTGQPETPALDLTAILTLVTLGLLDRVIRKFGARLAHNTLAELFSERSKLRFHQPSQVESAKELRGLLASGRLSEFRPVIGADPKLATSVGDDLAQMLATAKQRDPSGRQRLVVRSAPVHRIGSLQGDLVDLTECADVLVHCQPVVDRLAARGLLTQEEEERARAYLATQEKPWPNEIEVKDGAELFLDDLSVAYFQALRLLGKLAAAGLKPQITASEMARASGLVSYDEVASEGLSIIDQARDILAASIENGSVKVLPVIEHNGEQVHPSHAVLGEFSDISAVVVDDRFVNRFGTVSGASIVFTSMDLLDVLRISGEISEAEVWRHRTELRRMGYVHMPLALPEILDHLKRARMNDLHLMENAELRAVRENVALSQMGSWLNLPSEELWLNQLLGVLVDAIVGQWRDGISDAEARAKSNWLFHLSDGRVWAGCDTGGGAELLARNGLGIPFMRLLTAYHRVELSHRGRFATWLEGVFSTLTAADPSHVEWMTASFRKILMTRLEEAS
jgi:hypothetical protein